LYEGIVRISFLGWQVVAIQVNSDSILELQLTGAIWFPSTALRYHCLAAGPLELELPHALRQMMHRLHANFEGDTYDAAQDTATFTISPFGVGRVHVRLVRVPQAH